MTPVPLLGAKLLPPSTGPLHLPRPRLHRRLASGLEGRATFVVAGPGYGKTGLVARFLRDLGGDSVWYWLDPSDRDPWMLFRYLIQGVKEHAPEFGERSEGLWDSLRSASDEPERLADIFISDAQESLGGRLVIVLDNAQHLAGNDLCARALRRLVAYLPGALHLVLTGRSLPEPGLKTLGREVPVNVQTRQEGDCYARNAVRLQEIGESIRLCHVAIDQLPPGNPVPRGTGVEQFLDVALPQSRVRLYCLRRERRHVAALDELGTQCRIGHARRRQQPAGGEPRLRAARAPGRTGARGPDGPLPRCRHRRVAVLRRLHGRAQVPEAAWIHHDRLPTPPDVVLLGHRTKPSSPTGTAAGQGWLSATAVRVAGENAAPIGPAPE